MSPAYVYLQQKIQSQGIGWRCWNRYVLLLPLKNQKAPSQNIPSGQTFRAMSLGHWYMHIDTRCKISDFLYKYWIC